MKASLFVLLALAVGLTGCFYPYGGYGNRGYGYGEAEHRGQYQGHPEHEQYGGWGH